MWKTPVIGINPNTSLSLLHPCPPFTISSHYWKYQFYFQIGSIPSFSSHFHPGYSQVLSGWLKLPPSSPCVFILDSLSSFLQPKSDKGLCPCLITVHYTQMAFRRLPVTLSIMTELLNVPYGALRDMVRCTHVTNDRPPTFPPFFTHQSHQSPFRPFYLLCSSHHGAFAHSLLTFWNTLHVFMPSHILIFQTPIPTSLT